VAAALQTHRQSSIDNHPSEMTADAAAQITLAAYLALAFLAVARQALRCDDGPVVWLLYAVQRAYSGLWFHWRANRRCPFPQVGPALIIANHRSPVDPLMLWTNSHLSGPRPKLRVISFMMAREYYERPGLNRLCRTMQCIPIDRAGQDTAPARAALRLLQQGKLVGVFPEGGINLEEGLRPASLGIAWLALRAQVPVYPVYIHNSPGGRSMVEPFVKGGRVRLTYGRPIDLSQFADQRKSHALLEEVTDRMMKRLAELGGETYHSRHDAEAPDVIPIRSEEHAAG
jgi:1-acyl-sn-glycerol-3-phosphate acyltransferase